MQEFVDRLKKYLTDNADEFYTSGEIETNFGAILSYEDFKFGEMLEAIDEFSKQFKVE